MRRPMSREGSLMRVPLPPSLPLAGRVRSGVVLALATMLAPLLPGTGGAQDAGCLVILHNNDGESQLLAAGRGLEDFGGAARFVTLVKQQRDQAADEGCAVLTLSS